MQPEERGNGKLGAVNEESGFDKKDKDVPGEMTTAKNFTSRQFSELFYNTESTKDKVLEADPNLGRSMGISHGREKTPVLHVTYTMRGQALVKVLVISFLQTF